MHLMINTLPAIHAKNVAADFCLGSIYKNFYEQLQLLQTTWTIKFAYIEG